MEIVNSILDNVNSVVVGKKEISKLILTAMLAKGHVLIEDVPGVGKTTFAHAFAKTFMCDFSRIQFTPDTMPGDVVGSSVYNFETHKFEYVKGAIMGNIVLADEINRTSPKTQASMLEAMAEGQVTVDGKAYKLPEPFVVIATQNPTMQRGTYLLPESQLDRFMLRLSVGYPSLDESIDIVRNNFSGKIVNNLDKIVDINQWLKLIEEADKVYVKDELVKYAAICVEQTRNHEKVSLGVSTRGLLAWVRAAKAYAFIEGRQYVTPDDFKYLSPYVLAHRLILKYSQENSIETSLRIVDEIIRKVQVPVGK